MTSLNQFKKETPLYSIAVGLKSPRHTQLARRRPKLSNPWRGHLPTSPTKTIRIVNLAPHLAPLRWPKSVAPPSQTTTQMFAQSPQLCFRQGSRARPIFIRSLGAVNSTQGRNLVSRTDSCGMNYDDEGATSVRPFSP